MHEDTSHVLIEIWHADRHEKMSLTARRGGTWDLNSNPIFEFKVENADDVPRKLWWVGGVNFSVILVGSYKMLTNGSLVMTLLRLSELAHILKWLIWQKMNRRDHVSVTK